MILFRVVWFILSGVARVISFLVLGVFLLLGIEQLSIQIEDQGEEIIQEFEEVTRDLHLKARDYALSIGRELLSRS